MTNTIFYSWQSDLNETRNVIRTALDKAVRNLNQDVAVEDASRVDQDTVGVAGWPEITSAILEKIEQCDVFVADITPINGPQSNFRLTPNPNVLFELGYALATGLGRTRILCIVNTSYVRNGDLKELPFDIRGSRPTRFLLEDPTRRSVSKGHEDPVRTNVRDNLAMSLERSLVQTFDAIKTQKDSTILNVNPHLATEHLERFQVVLDVQTSVPFQVIYRIQEPDPYNKILSSIMTSNHPIDPKGQRRIRFPVQTLKPRSPGNDTYVLWGKVGHIATESRPVPEMREFEIRYSVSGDSLIETYRRQPPSD